MTAPTYVCSTGTLQSEEILHHKEYEGIYKNKDWRQAEENVCFSGQGLTNLGPSLHAPPWFHHLTQGSDLFGIGTLAIPTHEELDDETPL